MNPHHHHHNELRPDNLLLSDVKVLDGSGTHVSPPRQRQAEQRVPPVENNRYVVDRFMLYKISFVFDGFGHNLQIE